MKDTAFTLAAIVALGFFLAWFTQEADPNDRPFGDKFQSACVDEISARLKAPTTFNLIEFERLPDQPFTMDWWSERQPDRSDWTTDRQKDLLEALTGIAERKAARGDSIAAAIVTYDASNSFGTPVRTRQLCEYVFATSSEADHDFDSLTIDGRTNSDWMISRISSP